VKHGSSLLRGLESRECTWGMEGSVACYAAQNGSSCRPHKSISKYRRVCVDGMVLQAAYQSPAIEACADELARCTTGRETRMFWIGSGRRERWLRKENQGAVLWRSG